MTSGRAKRIVGILVGAAAMGALAWSGSWVVAGADGGTTVASVSAPHPSVRVADVPGRYEAGLRPGGEPGDRRVGVVWHTQGSGKSLTMAFYAGRMILHPAMGNPTLVVLTDRNDLDDQLFGAFARCQDLLRQPPRAGLTAAPGRARIPIAARGPRFSSTGSIRHAVARRIKACSLGHLTDAPSHQGR